MTSDTRAITSLSSVRIHGGGRKVFWAWIAYQAVKGTLTTALIWVPLLIAFWGE